jgi:hypothetical protein
MSKCCHYATNDLKVCGGIKEVSIKETQSFIQKKIIWNKKSVKGRQEWAKVCKNAYFCPRKLKILFKIWFASKVKLFKETLEFKRAINLWYSW